MIFAGRFVIPRSGQPGINMYSVIRRHRHSSGSSNDGLFIVQATTHHEGRRDSATSDLFINSGVMNREGPALLPTSPSFSPPPPPPNTLASEAPEFRVQLRDTITSFLENAELTSEIPELNYSEEREETQENFKTPKKEILAAMVSSALKSFTLTSLITECRGMTSLTGLDVQLRMPAPSKVTVRTENSAQSQDINLMNVITVPASTSAPHPLSTIPESSLTHNSSSSSPPSPILNPHPSVPSTSQSSLPGSNTWKRRRLDSSSESLSPMNSNLNPDAAAFTPGSVSANARSNVLGARPRLQTGRKLFKRPKKTGAFLG